MDGFGWLIKNALAGAGVEIDPDEIRHSIETAKILIPRIAFEFENMKDAQARIERKLDILLSLTPPQVQALITVPSELPTNRYGIDLDCKTA